MSWEVRWNDWVKQWEIIEPIGKPSEEGTQSYALMANCQSRLIADLIINAYEYWVAHLNEMLSDR